MSQGLIALMTACGMGSSEISAGSERYQLFTTVLIFLAAVPGRRVAIGANESLAIFTLLACCLPTLQE